VWGEPPFDVEATLRRKALRPRTLVSLVIPIVILLLLARRLFTEDVGEIWTRLREADPRLLALACGVFYLSVLVRTLRWQTLLANVGYRRSAGYRLPSTAGLAKIVLLASFANSITIGQVGDLLRGYLLKRRTPGVSFTITVGTIVAERLLDVVALVALLSGSAIIAFRGDLPAVAVNTLAGGLVLAGIGSVVLLSLGRVGPLVERFLPLGLQVYYRKLAAGTMDSFQRVPVLFVFTAVGWLVEGATIYLTAAAVGAPLSAAGALVVAMLASLLGVISITPGGIGVTEAGIILLLQPLGVDPMAAAAIAVLNRVINYWSITLVGFIVYAIRGSN
jgi:uncharacterized protein (TIRG00374 family)